jgi:hypothetical protein
MTMYLPNRDVRPTGYEAGEFIEPPPDLSAPDPGAKSRDVDREADEPTDR